MTAPYRPPPKSLDGRTARELYSYERTTDNGDTTLPPATLKATHMAALSIYDNEDSLRLVRQPATSFLYFGYNRKRYNAEPFTHARLCVDRKVAGASGATLRVEFTDDPTDDSSWASAGSTVPVDVSLAGTGPATTEGLVPLVAGARADVFFRVVAIGGDNVLSPEVNAVEIEFDSAPLPTRERWYWRTGTPSVNPIDDSPTDVLEYETTPPNPIGNPNAFWGCAPPPILMDWQTVTHDPVTAPQILLRSKGNAEAGLSTTTPNGHWNVSGPVGRFVGPPLAAQTIPAFDYGAGFSGIAYSGSVAGHAALRLSLYRPGVGFVRSVIANPYGTIYGALWYRYVPKSHVTTMSMGPIAAQAGDRFVLDVAADVEIACAGGFVTEGLGVTLYFNGSNDSFVDFGDAPGSTASWLELPKLQYVSETP